MFLLSLTRVKYSSDGIGGTRSLDILYIHEAQSVLFPSILEWWQLKFLQHGCHRAWLLGVVVLLDEGREGSLEGLRYQNLDYPGYTSVSVIQYGGFHTMGLCRFRVQQSEYWRCKSMDFLATEKHAYAKSSYWGDIQPLLSINLSRCLGLHNLIHDLSPLKLKLSISISHSLLLPLLPFISQAQLSEHDWRLPNLLGPAPQCLRQEISGEFLSQGNHAAPGIRTTDPWPGLRSRDPTPR